MSSFTSPMKLTKLYLTSVEKYITCKRLFILNYQYRHAFGDIGVLLLVGGRGSVSRGDVVEG